MASLVHGLFGTGQYFPDPARPSGVPGPATLVSTTVAQVILQYDAATGQLSAFVSMSMTLSSLLIESSGIEFILARSPTKGAFDFVSASQLFLSEYAARISTNAFGAALLPNLSEVRFCYHLFPLASEFPSMICCMIPIGLSVVGWYLTRQVTHRGYIGSSSREPVRSWHPRRWRPRPHCHICNHLRPGPAALRSQPRRLYLCS